MFATLFAHPQFHRLAPAAALVGGVGLSTVWRPTDVGPGLCVFRQVTGHWCPGCGMTRGVLALFRGNFSTSLAYHPLAVVLVIEAVVFAVWNMTGHSVPKAVERSWLPINLVALLVVFAYRSTYGSFPVPGSLAG